MARCQLITVGVTYTHSDRSDVIRVAVDIVRSHQQMLRGAWRFAEEQGIGVM